ncbi:MAG: hypothetical protein GXO56_05760 [Chloroflexi bacterium]|nr:hypothetical protein [Chloroflexota bacterium]
MWQKYILAANLEDALEALSQYGEKARVVAGATDLMLELQRRVRRGVEVLVDVTRIAGLDQVTLDADGWVHVGPLVTHNQAVVSPVLRRYGFPLAQASWGVGSPQIRNRGTIAGNLVTASPANDTIVPLMALGAQVTLRSTRGERVVPLAEFYTGVRRTVMAPDEMLTDIAFPAMRPNQRGVFLKMGLRQAQVISVVSAAVVLTFNGDVVEDARITLGAVAPTIIRAPEAEAALKGKRLDDEVIEKAARLASEAARPIDDLRASADYRRRMVAVLVKRGLQRLAEGREREDFPEKPPLLWGKANPSPKPLEETLVLTEATPIRARVNGQEMALQGGFRKSLLRLLREEAGFTGPKEGCAEGECGACEIYLDGVAVLSCLVPAPRAYGSEIVTVEGLAQHEALHPVQQAFVDAGAVQCGYCTPGFVMTTVKLLEEDPHPDRETIRQALSGNLCRCTGYYKILRAVERAASEE